METHKVLSFYSKRGDAPKVDHELGLKTGGFTARAHAREPQKDSNLASGRLSPLAHAEEYLLARDKVNEQTVDAALFHLRLRIALSRVARRGYTPEQILLETVVSITRTLLYLLLAVIESKSKAEKERRLYDAGIEFERVAMMIESDETEPLAKAA